MFSKRTQWERQPNDISLIIADFRRQGQSVLDLTESNPTRSGFVYPQEDILTPFLSPDNLSYAPVSQGSLAARQAISAYYAQRGFTVSPEQVFLTSSTSEGYAFLFRLLADPGDTVIFPRPSYPLFQFLVDLNDLSLQFYPLCCRQEWRIDLETLSEMMSPDVKAVVLVNPNNPTGSYVHPEDLVSLRELCQRNSCAVISDEVFLDYAFSGVPGQSLVGEKSQLTFVLGGVSKSLGLPQMKLSWIVVTGPADLQREASDRLEIIADTFLSVNTPVQNALAHWLGKGAGIATQILERVKRNRALAISLTAGSSCHVLAAEGGWYLILQVPPQFSEEELVLSLLKEDGVYVHPGYFFDFDDEPYLVLSLLPTPDIFEEGLQRILRRLR